MKSPEAAVDSRAGKIFAAHGVKLTLGGEPTYVPTEPIGPEWSIAALGPTKLGYAYGLANALIEQKLPNALAVYTPGKHYPGELNPRWAIMLVWRRDGAGLITLPTATGEWTKTRLQVFRDTLVKHLRIKGDWLRGVDPLDPEKRAWVLPLDHDGKRFNSEGWELGLDFDLLRTEGPAGLRLPLNTLPAEATGRALTLEMGPEGMQLFLPPLAQKGFVHLLQAIGKTAKAAPGGTITFAGYVPSDEADDWTKLGIAADPGVLEINLPPCHTATEYAEWLAVLEKAGEIVGLRSYKQFAPDVQAGTGGGNHLLFGGPSFEENALFRRPDWMASILRYWQHHPSLGYLFTGDYVGSSSQAPRPDESASAHYDLELAYQFLETLELGDHRHVIGETLRHLHTDTSGNTHRSEISFDKFWNLSFQGGCRGLVEFRAIETLPRADWMSAVGALWVGIAAMLLETPFHKPLIEYGDRLHDEFFLPSVLWADFEKILRDLKKVGIDLPVSVYREICEWRFPVLLEHQSGSAKMRIRRAHESWPLLCEQPLEGGTTSRFVDTSIERLELIASSEFVERCKVRVQGRLLAFDPLPGKHFGLGLRYRRSALYPSLHPGLPPQVPLLLTVEEGRTMSTYQLTLEHRMFRSVEMSQLTIPKRQSAMRKLAPELVTYDLRLP